MIDYELKKSLKAKHLRITIKRDGTVTVTVPRRVSIARAELFVEEKRVWIEEKVEEFKARKAKLSAPTIPIGSAKELKLHKEAALALVLARLAHFNAFYKLKWNTVTIKDTSSRWGSCSKKGNLNFSYRILFLAPELADYLVVHELCHLGEFNHSQKFWSLVSQSIPNYANLRKQLKNIE